MAEEEMEEYKNALSVLRDNLWTRICELGGDRTVEMNVPASCPCPFGLSAGAMSFWSSG